jgi:hypothetical protein
MVRGGANRKYCLREKIEILVQAEMEFHLPNEVAGLLHPQHPQPQELSQVETHPLPASSPLINCFEPPLSSVLFAAHETVIMALFM